MEEKSKAVVILESLIPFLFGVIILEIIFMVFFKSSRPLGHDFTFASIALFFLGLSVAFYESKEMLSNILRTIAIVISVAGAFLCCLDSLDGMTPGFTFLHSLFMVALCYQCLAYEYVEQFMEKRFSSPNIVAFAPLITFVLLTIVGIPFALLAHFVNLFFGFWLLFIPAVPLSFFVIVGLFK